MKSLGNSEFIIASFLTVLRYPFMEQCTEQGNKFRQKDKEGGFMKGMRYKCLVGK